MLKSEETWRLYKWESYTISFKHFPERLTKRRSMAYLRRLAHQIWAKHGRNGIATLDIKAWNSTYWMQEKKQWRGWSYSAGFKEMRLGRDYRTVQYLLHELTHCIGYASHGRGFLRKYGELLVEYGGVEEGWLALSMGMFGIKLPEIDWTDH